MMDQKNLKESGCRWEDGVFGSFVGDVTLRREKRKEAFRVRPVGLTRSSCGGDSIACLETHLFRDW